MPVMIEGAVTACVPETQILMYGERHMIVQCRYRRHIDVPASERARLPFLEAEFDVVVGDEYVVYGQSIFNAEMYYLLDPGENGAPAWYPAEAFRVIDATVPGHWEYAFYATAQREGVAAVWGYDKLINDDAHYDELSNADPDARLAFVRAKARNG
ncbi:MAG: hypothetical protein JWP35_3903 [Caulobacter sp.]|nr:hypothetical protein [Caulobacter sp.]